MVGSAHAWSTVMPATSDARHAHAGNVIESATSTLPLPNNERADDDHNSNNSNCLTSDSSVVVSNKMYARDRL